MGTTGVIALVALAAAVAYCAPAIPTLSPIHSDNPKYGAYMDAVRLFKSVINTSIDPCDDFYAFTCGNFNSDQMSFDVSDNDNGLKMARQLKKKYYIDLQPLPVKQTAWYFQQCRTAQKNWDNVANGKPVQDAISGLLQFGVPFPMINQTISYLPPLTPNQLGSLLGYLVGQEGIPTLISPSVDTNWKDPHGPNGYALYIDQPTTVYSYTYYVKAWKYIRPSYVKTVVANMKALTASMGVNVNSDRLQRDAEDIVDLEYRLAMEFSTDDTTRRNYMRSYNAINRVDAAAQYSFIDWRTFLAHSISPGGDDVYWKVVHDPSYLFMIMEPAKLAKLGAALQSFDQRTLVNYLYYRLVDSYSEFLPQTNMEAREDEWSKPYLYKPMLGRAQHVMPEQRRFKRQKFTDDQLLDINCAMETMGLLQYSNARVFVDAIYPTQDDRNRIRYSVRQIAETILVGFRSMLDQLSWMSRSTRTGAFAKIENLVKNIAFPDWITDDAKLTAYYAPLTIAETDDYVTMFKKASYFGSQVQLLNLLRAGGADRVDFNGPPGTTNAWYQPELNSITFPAAILRQPFFDPDWPASINFGSMGVIAGHELTHGFDDEGVQWDGTGALNTWMDPMSNMNFHEMADCVVQEYSNFCPLPANYSEAACIDGAQTQGENIADNGGIHSAFRAYRNYINLNGPDPLLPDDVLSQFTADQLFFMSFAQVWCQLPPSPEREMRQLLVDVHSPSLYRVFGTIQNFPAFKTAFNCPFDSKYAPQKHCNVWVSDVKQSTGIPQVKNEINVPTPPAVAPRNLSVYSAYKQAVDFFQGSVNFSADPCNDFYTYSCGYYDKPLSNFHYADEKNKGEMAAQLLDATYQATIQKSAALTATKNFFEACRKATPTMANDIKTLNLVRPKVDQLQKVLGASFTGIFSQDKPVTTAPTPAQLASALAYLSFTLGVDTLVTPMIDTKWAAPNTGYILHADQNTAFWSKSYYGDGAWSITQPMYSTMATNLMKNFAQSQGVTLDATKLSTLLNSLLEFERKLATTYSTDDTTRRKYWRSWNNMPVSQLTTTYPFLDWVTYFKSVPAGPKMDATSVVNVLELDKYAALNKDLATLATPDVLVNYLYLRLLLAYQDFVPTYGSAQSVVERPWAGLGRQRWTGGQREVVPSLSDVTDTDVGCAGATMSLLQFANGRVFIDRTYPNQAAKDVVRSTAGGLISNVLNAFQGMLDGLDWMDPGSKKGAYDKILNIQKNIAFPDWITDNAQLDAYYSTLTFTPQDTYYTMLDKLTQFNIWVQYNQLNKKSTDRTDFLGQPGVVNAWYQPELNSITFPAGILRPPYFHPEWPASLNYAGMGLVAGHELTHGFDDEGVQWDGTGILTQQGWMSKNSTAGFDKMAQCVIDEYSSFCPLKGTNYQPQCINGQNTQGENIADNGGIHSAYRAYRNHVNLNGPDPLLDDRVLGQFTHDQLFFLNFGQVWCQKRESPAAYYRQIMIDPHSPANYRVFGTIQNYPAFRAAYNCPIGSAYGPVDHCKVWVPTNAP